MSRNESAESESAEFEVVMGNKQLLSVFFVVVVLLGVFFTMGYVVGRNSVPLDSASAEKPEQYSREATPSATSSAVSIAESPSVEQTAPPTTESVPTAVETRTVAPPPRAAAVAPVADPPVATGVRQPLAGRTYIQVLAVAKPQADVLAEVLVKKGFKAFVAPGPNEKQYRVLVGPATDIDHASRMKSELEAAGFKPFVKKF